ncbi:MAG: alanine--tRNA ligase, partial [Phototrophicales bacterium]
ASYNLGNALAKQQKYDEAIEAGALALFDYHEKVRVIKMGPSIELCGGSHVSSTSEVGLFKIIKYSAVSAGVKRIEAIVGKTAWQKTQDEARILKELQCLLN